MARIRGNYIFGTLLGSLTAGDTTMSAASLADLPAVASPDYAVVTIHDGANFEIVHVTAHTAAATTATILRGQEGTTAQAWLTDTGWLHGPTAADLPRVQDTEPTEPEVGEVWIGPASAPSGGTSLGGALAYRASGTQTIAANGHAAVTLPSESYDDDTYHDTTTNTSRLTITTTGRYRVFGQVEFASNTTGIRYAAIWKNGVSTGTRLGQTTIPALSDTTNPRLPVSTPIVQLTAGDYVELGAYHTVSPNLDVTGLQGAGSTWLCIERIS